MTRIVIPPPVSGGLLLSYRCSASCRHCMYACSPQWDGDWISEEALDVCLTALSGSVLPSPGGRGSIGLNYGLHFTGGEPFLNFDLLLKAARRADELNIPSTFVETNSFWCREDDTTRERLELLKTAGLGGILISVNPFYAEYVPFERTERCVRLSREVFGDNVIVYQMEYYHLFRHLTIRERLLLEDYMALTKDSDVVRRVELFLMGRAAQSLRSFYPAYPAEVFFGISCRPPFLREWHNHFDNYGNIMPGYCGGISLGNWKELDQLVAEGIDLGQRPILNFLVHGDMRGLFDFTVKRGYRPLPSGYVSRCDLCLDMRKYLVSVDNFDELKPAEFYHYLR